MTWELSTVIKILEVEEFYGSGFTVDKILDPSS